MLSRWAYPASLAERDISIHGSENDDIETRRLMEEEKEEEEKCMHMSEGDLNAETSQVGLPLRNVLPVGREEEASSSSNAPNTKFHVQKTHSSRT